MRRPIASECFGILFGLAVCSPTVAQTPTVESAPASLFQDHMVLQCDQPIPVWGTAPPGSEIEVAIAGQTTSASADPAGRFEALLGPLAAGGPHTLRIGDVTLEDVLVGEVWLCSGQSNMRWAMRAFDDCETFLDDADDDELRLFTVARAKSTTPLTTCEGRWNASRRETASDFSAVAWHFGQQLRQHFGVPVGLVLSAWGGTRAEAWTRPAALAQHAALQPILSTWRAKPIERQDHRHAPGALFHGMVEPLVPFGFRGVLWYQGESNGDRGDQYGTLFPTLIHDWRERFGQGDLPFLFVQLARFGRTKRPWQELREAQRQTARTMRATAMASAVDLGETENVHPANKREVARRLLLAARHVAYHEPDVVWSGPRLHSMRVSGQSGIAELRFGLDGSDLRSIDGSGRLLGFVVAGEDREFFPARAEIASEDTVVVRCEQVRRPVAVRYLWRADPRPTLYNAEGLPASPFRTDAWPLTTAGRNTPLPE